MILLDTDVLVDIFRELPAAVAWMETLDEEKLALPGYVVLELLQGCHSTAQIQSTRQRLAIYAILWPEPSDCTKAIDLYARYWLSHGLGMVDTLIAQTAMAHNLPLHTFNVKHYTAVSDLQTIQPYSRT